MHFDDKKLSIFYAFVKIISVIYAIAVFAFFFILFADAMKANNAKLLAVLIIAMFIALASVWMLYAFWCCLISHWFDTKLIRNKLYNVSNKELVDDVYNSSNCAQFKNESDNNIEKNGQSK